MIHELFDSRNQTKPLLGIETNAPLLVQPPDSGRNQTKPLLGIETFAGALGPVDEHGRNQTKPLLGIETLLSECDRQSVEPQSN